jgi:hypothetical protein
VKTAILAVLSVALVVLAILYVKSVGLTGKGFTGSKKNNLQDIDCNLHQGITNTVIETDEKKGITYANEGVLVCPGEMVQWSTGKNVTKVEVDFNPLNWPFSGSAQKLTATPNNPTTPMTVKQLGLGYRIQPAKYTITVTTTSGQLPSLDPHLIPMGP